MNRTTGRKAEPIKSSQAPMGVNKNKVTFETFAEEVIEKIVMQQGTSGRIYVPPSWVGFKVKVVRIA